MPSARRSGRATGTRKSYTQDVFQVAGISDESDNGGQAASSKPKPKRVKREDSPSDEEFVAAFGDETNGGIDNGEEEEDDEKEMEDVPDGSDLDQMDVDEPSVINRRGKGKKTKERMAVQQRDISLKKRKPDGIIVPDTTETHSRGLIDPKDHLSKSTYYNLTFGADDRDLIAAIYFRGVWNLGSDSVFPTRATLEGPRPDGHAYGPTHGVHPDDVKRESTRGWDWYYEKEPRERFQKRQRIEKIKETAARQNYLPQPKNRHHDILLGPYDNQQLFSLEYHESFDYGNVWGERQSSENESTRKTNKIREGWILNLGHKITCMAWAPNHDGLTQYLAVAVPITEEQKKPHKADWNEPLSSLKPSPPFPCAIQIWEFKAKTSDTSTKTLDMESKPQLRQALCAEWGDLTRMSWCRLPRAKRDEDDEKGTKSIGLLAGVWGDGKVKVLDIKLRRGSKETEYIKLHSPAFEAKPPSAICTCVTWMSPSDIAVGCSNGFVAIWNIASSASEPLPFFYRPIHSTWVLDITSVYPNHPQHAITISMDGETYMWSILDPVADKVSTVRMRMPAPHISYSPILQSAVSGDEQEYARLIPIRRFFTSNGIGRFSSNVSALAPCSFSHPCVLYGSAAGEVLGVNPFRRVVYNKEQVFQQMWFTHEWVPSSKAGTAGTSRFFDGYRADNQRLVKHKTTDTKPITGITTSTIYEEGTHVTALGWNPNPSCCAWASAALGSGLVRVEDLAI
ncbi:hypothetical protein PENANT_c009G04057 [Penicillium antarcticum]|uniref:Transcription factor TFIIIC complex subunit Tfc6 n=1 Tax=Penicillium antarcticum TaxID=416450 RepID=A0A1V6Q8V6_9EURO|nr:uncharacterized protein N7508_008800 [Penicillium antarcticum]KAJ5293979.1 hypothetical protein N7508_008800 [Penicillium antarcticum]OQD85669.1 hypothetical protein PENANT_c009G04057 [Penicillium antarcticum]